jgi:hypothetical protein
MIQGIYRLNFLPSDYFYIGWSKNIHDRYINHKSHFKLGKSASKLQSKYEELGKITPELVIIEETDDFSREMFYINQYKSSELLLNTSGSYDMYRRNATFSEKKYSKEQIEEVFFLLVEGTLSIQEISDLTEVHISTVKEIKSGRVHGWLRNEYTLDYDTLIYKHTSIANSLSGRPIEEEVEILKIFNILYANPHTTLKKLADEYSITYTTLVNISSGLHYKWLEEIDKTKYLAVTKAVRTKSVYSIKQLEQVVNYLLDTKLTYMKISELTGVKNTDIGRLKRGERYSSLLRDYLPEDKFNKLKELNDKV